MRSTSFCSIKRAVRLPHRHAVCHRYADRGNVPVKIWIDIEDTSGNKYGEGPITSATGWTSTRRLDAAGAFSFTMPASDPMSSHLGHKRVVRCWTFADGALKEMGAGIIERITWQPEADGATIITVEGDDLLRELARRTVGDLKLFKEVEYVPELFMQPSGATITLPASVNLEPDNFFYVQRTTSFSRISFTISSGQSADTETLQIQYYNDNGERAAWEALPGVVNGTAVAGGGASIRPFAQTGTLEFDTPAGWSIEPISGRYIIRFRDNTTNLSAFTLSACTVTVIEPVSDALQQIMALAPPGWSLDPTGELATADDVYMQFSGESVLAALVLLAQQTGEHFVLSPSARRVKWLGLAQQSSGLRAVQGTDVSDNTMLIASLTASSDSYELYTRVYPYGGGVGSGRLTMEHTTRSQAGYAFGADNAYLEATAAIALYGQIDKRLDYSDIAPVKMDLAQVTNAANTLFDRVYNDLSRKSQLQFAYDLSVIPARYAIWPGSTIRVVYHEWVDNFHAMNIDDDLWILETSQTISTSGVTTIDLVVATVDYWPGNDYRAIARMMGDAQVERSVEMPTTGITSVGAGVPTQLGVQNGQIISVKRVVAIDDGKYPPDGATIKEITIKSGIITNMVLEDF